MPKDPHILRLCHDIVLGTNHWPELCWSRNFVGSNNGWGDGCQVVKHSHLTDLLGRCLGRGGWWGGESQFSQPRCRFSYIDLLDRHFHRCRSRVWSPVIYLFQCTNNGIVPCCRRIRGMEWPRTSGGTWQVGDISRRRSVHCRGGRIAKGVGHFQRNCWMLAKVRSGATRMGCGL